MNIGIFGVPFNGDGTPPQIENPAAALRDAGLSRLVAASPHLCVDFGDLAIPDFEGRRDPITHILNQRAWREVSLRTAKRLHQIRERTDFVVVLGGDCSIFVGICGAFKLADERVGLVVVDGHTDYRDPFRSPTGEPADLEMAVLTGRGPVEVTGLFGEPPILSPGNVVICGYREADLIAQSTIAHYDRQAFRKTGAAQMALLALHRLSPVERVWLHLDVDVLDPGLMPVCFPEPDGLGIDETVAFLSTALGHGPCVGISLACYHPCLDPTREAASTIVDILEQTINPVSGG